MEYPAITKFLKSKRFAKLLLLVIAVVLINFGGSWLARQIDFQLFPRHDSMLQLAIAGCALLYIILMAIPFLPGIEIGLALMLLLGNKGALLVYLCTLLALSISFTIRGFVSKPDGHFLAFNKEAAAQSINEAKTFFARYLD